MKRFVSKHTGNITGIIECFDRVVFKGYLPISADSSMEAFLSHRRLLIKDFKRFVLLQSEKLRDHARRLAEKTGRPVIHLSGPQRKEDKVREIAARDGVTGGLVCILTAVESTQSFRMVPGEGRPRLVNAGRKCLCLYFYYLDREFGLMHIRLPTWFPFPIQVCLNGHDWLDRKLTYNGIAHHKEDNAFLRIDNPARAQRLADRFTDINWPRILSTLARRVNPLLTGLLEGMDYYWVVDQAEFSTDIMFADANTLKDLYPELVEHAILCFTAEDVLTFLGRKLHGRFKGEVISDSKKRHWGRRVKHRMKNNWIKMYDKNECVLRIETVINHPYEFKVRRRGIRRGQEVTGWFPMAKGVANLYRYREVSLAANHRYLDALAEVNNPSKARKSLKSLAQPLHKQERSFRGFNPMLEKDFLLFAAVMRGEHTIMGFRNKDIRQHLFSPPKDDSVARRQSARVSSLLARLHVRGLIAKIPRSRRWRVTRAGYALMSMVLKLHREQYPDYLMKLAS